MIVLIKGTLLHLLPFNISCSSNRLVYPALQTTITRKDAYEQHCCTVLVATGGSSSAADISLACLNVADAGDGLMRPPGSHSTHHTCNPTLHWFVEYSASAPEPWASRRRCIPYVRHIGVNYGCQQCGCMHMLVRAHHAQEHVVTHR